MLQRIFHIIVFGIVGIDFTVQLMNFNRLSTTNVWMIFVELIYIIVFALLYFTGDIKQRKKQILGANISFILLNAILLNHLLQK